MIQHYFSRSARLGISELLPCFGAGSVCHSFGIVSVWCFGMSVLSRGGDLTKPISRMVLKSFNSSDNKHETLVPRQRWLDNEHENE